MARWVYRWAHTSPARPWRYTASTAVSKAGTPWAKKAPAIPASTSPLPPLAMPGLPVGFTAQRPSGAATTVAAPFSATTAPVSLAFCRAAPNRSAWISGMVSSHSRAISPG